MGVGQLSNQETNEIEQAAAENDLLQFDGQYYRRSLLNEQQMKRIAEVEQIAKATLTGQDLANFVKHFATIIDFALGAQINLRGQIRDEIKSAQLSATPVTAAPSEEPEDIAH